jgi:hypothetical protein
MNHIGNANKMVSDTPISDSTPHNAANVEIKRLTKKVAQLYEGAEEGKQRIKRLEEAGDYLCAAAAFMGWHDKIETWNKAKEAKP